MNHVIISLDGRHLDAMSMISTAAFDPAFGEAWNIGQIIAIIGLPGYKLFGCAGGDGQLAGFAIVRHMLDESELLLLAVHPAAQRCGMAHAMIEYWRADAQKSGVERLLLEVRADNPARALYLKMGFTWLATRPEYYRGGDGKLRDSETMQHVIVQNGDRQTSNIIQ